jgi:hypothetical protein
VPGVWARYRRHEGNVTNQVDEYALPEHLRMFAALEEQAPEVITEIRRARSERLATFGFRSLLAGQRAEGAARLAASLGHSPLGLLRALRNAVRYYRKRAPRSTGGRPLPGLAAGPAPSQTLAEG